MWPYLKIGSAETVKLRLYCLKVGPTSNDRCLYKEEGKVRTHGHTQGRGPRARGGRNWNDAARSQGAARIARDTRSRERPGTNSPSKPAERTNPANSVVADFWPPQLWKNKFLLFQATWFVVLCYSSPRKLIHCLLGFFKKEGFKPNILFPSKKDSGPHLAKPFSFKL